MSWLNTFGVWINDQPLGSLPLWSYALLALVDTHITTACVTLYLHRCETHAAFRSVHGPHFMRFWLWGRTADATRSGCGAQVPPTHTSTPPKTLTVPFLWHLARVFMGTALYHTAATTRGSSRSTEKGTPDDALERRLYDPLS